MHYYYVTVGSCLVLNFNLVSYFMYCLCFVCLSIVWLSYTVLSLITIFKLTFCWNEIKIISYNLKTILFMKSTVICFPDRTVINGIYRNLTEPPPRSHPTPGNRNVPVENPWHVRKAFICNRTGNREHWCRPIIFIDLVVFTVYSLCYISNILYKITSALTKLRDNVSIFKHWWERLDHKTLVMPTRPWMPCVAVLIN